MARLGRALNLSDRSLNELSRVTSADIATAQELWRNNAPTEFATILDAQTIDEEDEEFEEEQPQTRQSDLTLPLIGAGLIASQFGWDEQAGRYIDLSSGSVIPTPDVRDALEPVMEIAGQRMNIFTQQLIDGEIPLAEWQSGMMEQIKLAHTAAAASSRGGWAQMSQADWGATGRLIRKQYDYLRNFANQIASGEQALNGVALVRSDLYAGAARGTFEEIHRRYERTMNGMEEERRVLGSADHCEGCLSQAELGWQPIGTLDPIGSQECLTRCHCTFEYRRVGPDGELITSEDEE